METRLRRGLFGYSRKSVTAVVNDREMSIITASRGSKEAKDEVEGARRRARQEADRGRRTAGEEPRPRVQAG